MKILMIEDDLSLINGLSFGTFIIMVHLIFMSVTAFTHHWRAAFTAE